MLAGGLGGSRCVHALSLAAGPEHVTAIGNVGDDLEMWDLHVSPDLDTIMYTLAGLLDEERGWGIRGDTYEAMAVAEQAGRETWFTLGDQDAGVHILRTRLLKNGQPLSTVTGKLAEGLGLGVRLLPATDDRLRTKIQTPDGELDFQEWFVRRRHADRVDGVRFEGAEDARPAPGVLDAIKEADVVLIAPSNPFVSIQPILAVPGIEEALRTKHVAAVSPLVGGKALRGPLAEMMASLGHEPGAVGVRALYGDLVSTFVLDREDEALADAIPGAAEAIAEAEVVVIAPSNPFVSIRPILAVPGIEEALRERRVAAISPLVGGKALRGPLAEMMASLGHEPSAAGVRALYGDLSVFVLDREDAALADAIPGAVVCDTVMVLPERRAEVGRGLLEAIG